MAGSPESPERAPALLLVALCWTTFLVAGAATAIAPFFLDMARDLRTDLAAVANLVAVLSVAWGVMSLAAGSASDRLGRRPILVAAVLVLGASRIGLTAAGSYGAAVAWQVAGGMGGGSFMGTVYAAVSDHVPPAARGRALGWVITGQSLALVFGVPAFTFLGGLVGWRGAIAVQAAATLLTAAAVWPVVPPARPRRAAGTMERVCFAGMAVYLATYLLTTYGVSLSGLAVGLGLTAVGSLAGNVLGGHLADRLPARALTFAATSVVTGGLALPLMLWQPGLAGSIALGFAYSLANALGRPALMVALSEVSSEARGAILGLNITTGSLGWIGAAGVGGWLIARSGFGGLGVVTAAAALAGAAFAVLSWWLGRPRAAH